MLGDPGVPVAGMGCMRLSTEADRDEAVGIAALHAAFDAGVTLLDTADAYCLGADEIGHNERLIARAIATWSGDRTRIRVATKGGLTRPNGRWVADGRARHLVSACEASRRALAVERIDLYQLHAIDPRTPLATSVRALDALRRDGLIKCVGLCNVNVGQIEEARQLTAIDVVQGEMSVWHDANLLNGVAEYCLANAIPLLAYRPLGGIKRRRRTLTDPVLNELATRHGATPFEIALAWLMDLSDLIVPLPGATRVESVRSIARARALTLGDEDRARLDDRAPAAMVLRTGRSARAETVRMRTDGEVVLIMGLPGAGKSTIAGGLVADGYVRLNRDEAGGSLSDLLPALDRAIASGASRIVVDNTYVSRQSRVSVIRTAARHGLPVRCLWLSTSIEDAQVNAASRILSRYGRLLTPEAMRVAARDDVAAFGPTTQFRYQRELEPPTPLEGFSRIDVLRFERRRDPARRNRAVIVWCDGVLRRGRSKDTAPPAAGDDLFAERGAVLKHYQADGWLVLGMSWQPGIDEGVLTAADVDAAFTRMRAQLGVDIEVDYCPHAGGPPKCWCRKPLPGLGVVVIARHGLDPSQCIYVGTGAQDAGFARRLGFRFCEAAEFFGNG